MKNKDITEIDGTCRSVLRRYGRAIVHMRQQKSRQRFGLAFGSGASADFGFPQWDELIARIAEHPQVDGTNLLNQSRSQASLSQLLFQRFRALRLSDANDGDHEYNRIETRVRSDWQKIVHECLYRDVPDSASDIATRDKYLWAFMDVIKNTPLTVTYNFDDTLERLLSLARTSQERLKKRGFKTVWNSNIQLNSQLGVVYHPNGFLPSSLLERPSEHLVFLEDSFADQLIDSMVGHYTALLNHLAQTTCLLVGLSLSDATLKHLLRQNARSFPGHYHYYVAYVPEGKSRDGLYKESAASANFEVYNLITLFLTASEIAALGKLLSLEDADFVPLAEEVGQQPVMRFFITGCVSVGKSTTTNQFRSLATHDEWTEARAPGMELAPELLTEEDRERIDAWVDDQIAKKNIALSGVRTGIHVIDRAPLDAFAFVPNTEWTEKARRIRTRVSPGEATGRRLVPGHVIFLLGDPSVMSVRALARHKVTDPEKLSRQQERLKSVYLRDSGVTVLDTREKSIHQVTKEVARIIHSQPYSIAPMDDWLRKIENGDITDSRPEDYASENDE